MRKITIVLVLMLFFCAGFKAQTKAENNTKEEKKISITEKISPLEPAEINSVNAKDSLVRVKLGTNTLMRAEEFEQKYEEKKK